MIPRTSTWSLLALVLTAGAARADLRTKACQEAAEAVMARFGAQAGRSLPALAQKIESLAARYGEEALVAVRRVGPEAFAVVEEAGLNGPRAVRVLAQYGEEGASCVLRRPKAMQQFLRFGDEAAAALVKHPGVAEGLIEQGGASAVQALAKVTPQGARRLAMVMEGELQTAAGKPELWNVVGAYGQRACDFVWANKEVLAGGAALAAFLANPEPFLNGVQSLAQVAGDALVKPAVAGIFTAIHLALGLLALLLVIVAVLAYKYGLPHPEQLKWFRDFLRLR